MCRKGFSPICIRAAMVPASTQRSRPSRARTVPICCIEMGLFFRPMMLALAEEAGHATDYDETLLPIAIAFVAIALVYAIVAAWIVTPKAGH